MYPAMHYLEKGSNRNLKFPQSNLEINEMYNTLRFLFLFMAYQCNIIEGAIWHGQEIYGIKIR